MRKLKLGDTLVVEGTYHRFDLEAPNPEAFEGFAVVYLKDFVMFIETPSTEAGQRPSAELKALHKKKVQNLGRVFTSVPQPAGSAAFNIGLEKHLQFIGRK